MRGKRERERESGEKNLTYVIRRFHTLNLFSYIFPHYTRFPEAFPNLTLGQQVPAHLSLSLALFSDSFSKFFSKERGSSHISHSVCKLLFKSDRQTQSATGSS